MKHRRRRCLCCKELFNSNPKSSFHQEFCSEAACQKASRALSQQRWQAKVENQAYWRGPDQVDRVRAWRKAHPKYWRRSARRKREALQRTSPPEPVQSREIRPKLGGPALQEEIMPKDPLITGIISLLAGSTLQEDIAVVCGRLVARGNEILGKQKGLAARRLRRPLAQLS